MTTVRHLAVCVTPKGKKSFVAFKRKPGAKHPTRNKLGLVGRMSLEQARERAIKFDPTPTRKFADVAEDYFKAKRKLRRAHGLERTIRRKLIPSWGNKQLSAITRQDVIDRVETVKAKGEYAAHGHHGLH